jgi:hypothetical protein
MAETLELRSEKTGWRCASTRRGHTDVKFAEYSIFGEIFAFLEQNLY